LQLAMLYIPVLQPVFHTTALAPSELAVCLSAALVVSAAVEAEKWWRSGRHTIRPQGAAAG